VVRAIRGNDGDGDRARAELHQLVVGRVVILDVPDLERMAFA